MFKSASHSRNANVARGSIESRDIRPLSFGAILGLHLLPGVGIFAFYLLGGPLIMDWGFPPQLAFLLGSLLVGIPIELGVLLYQGRRNTGKLTLRGSVGYREAMPLWQYGVIFVVFLVYGLGMQLLLSPIATTLSMTVFAGMPSYMQAQSAIVDAHVARTAILFTLIVQLIIDGIVTPTVEEIYFRGFLLPRLAQWGRLAPLVNALLFTGAHLWQPYNYLIILAVVLPEVYLVWWKRNIRISIMLHCTANLLGATLDLVGFFAMH